MHFNELKKYISNSKYSYALGAFVTVELIKHRPKDVLCVLIDDKFNNQKIISFIEKFCSLHHVPILHNQKIIDKIRTKENCLVIGVFKKYSFSSHNHINHVILEDIQDDGLLGTIIRSMQGFEFNHLILINPKVDIFHPHVIRASMGAFFNVNIEVFASFNDYLNCYPQHHIILCSHTGKQSLSTLKIPKRPISLYFSKCDNTTYPSIALNPLCSLENNVNIVFFHFYSLSLCQD